MKTPLPYKLLCKLLHAAAIAMLAAMPVQAPVCAAAVISPDNGATLLCTPSQPLTWCLDNPGGSGPVVGTALRLMGADLEAATGKATVATAWGKATVRICNLAATGPTRLSQLRRGGVPVDSITGHPDAYCLHAAGGCLYIAGADDRGTAYGVLELSRLAGVSPWVWWHDLHPLHIDTLSLPCGYSRVEKPGVRYRGVFINDEDWSLRPWSQLTHEPGIPGLGKETYRQLMHLLLRLRANTLWPAMHPGTVPFYQVDGAAEIADSCGIVLGTSHCEPLMRNNVGEWDTALRGSYNFITNRNEVLGYWTERLRQTRGRDCIYTLGMRGLHDGAMEGVKTLDEKTRALHEVIGTQRELLARHIDKRLERVPQVFVPYKEVLDIMAAGLEVPDDVTLMWCDDNYGYLTALGDSLMRTRPGGAGVYYHLSYWGRPHDYLWLPSTQPGLMAHQLGQAWLNGARRIWIANVHDPKTSSYQLELFLDLAWGAGGTDGAGSGGSGRQHLLRWLQREWGPVAGEALLPVMEGYYRLTAVRRPEHMGWSQVELADRKTYPRGRSQVTDTEFSMEGPWSEADLYLAAWRRTARLADSIGRTLPPERRDAWFSLIGYPVECGAAMAVKCLEAQRARSLALGQSDSTLLGRIPALELACARSQAAYQRIRTLTAYYNDSLAGGRWKHLMNMMPRDLYVFNPPILPLSLNDSECRRVLAAHPGDNMLNNAPAPAATQLGPGGCTALDAAHYCAATFTPRPVEFLGHSQVAVPLPRGESLEYEFTVAGTGEMPVELTVALIPTHPLDIGGDVRIAVAVDGGTPAVSSIREKGRTDRWKTNVMRNQARVTSQLTLTPGRHTLTVTALDGNIVLDQLMLDTVKNRRHYLIPSKRAQLTLFNMGGGGKAILVLPLLERPINPYRNEKIHLRIHGPFGHVHPQLLLGRR